MGSSSSSSKYKHAKKAKKEKKLFKPKSLNPSISPTFATRNFVDMQIYEQLFDKFKPDNQHIFPLQQVLNNCVSCNQIELLEFLVIEELMDTQNWSRVQFKAQIQNCIRYSVQLTKLEPIRIIASYLIPEQFSLEEFRALISKHMAPHMSDTGKQEVKQFMDTMIDSGIQDMTQRMIATRKALIAVTITLDMYEDDENENANKNVTVNNDNFTWRLVKQAPIISSLTKKEKFYKRCQNIEQKKSICGKNK
jgi:L-ribulose-5-phosphate 3-epimerase UlaE